MATTCNPNDQSLSSNRAGKPNNSIALGQSIKMVGVFGLLVFWFLPQLSFVRGGQGGERLDGAEQ